jgi:restriction endonuclease Mrr
LAENPEAIYIAYLSRFPEYVAFRYGPSETLTGSPAAPNSAHVPVIADARTPDDLIEEGYAQTRAALVTDLRERIATMPPPGGICR